MSIARAKEECRGEEDEEDVSVAMTTPRNAL